MKKLLLTILLIISVNAQAMAGSAIVGIVPQQKDHNSADRDTYFESRNEGGGRIVLTSEQPPDCNGWYLAFTSLPTGETAFGCWVFRNDLAKVIYQDGTVRFYPPEGFVMKQAHHKTLPAPQKYE